MKSKMDGKEDIHLTKDSVQEAEYYIEIQERDLFQNAVAEGIQAARNGEFATEEEVRRVFAKYGVEY